MKIPSEYFKPSSAFVTASFLLLLIIVSCTKTVSTYYPSGKTESEISYRSGRMNGNAHWYYENGALKQRATYSNDKLEKLLERWYPNGDKELSENYLHGMRNGTSRTWSENGQPEEEKNYQNDTLDGQYRKFYPDGILMIEGNYSKGLFDGNWYYYSNGGIRIGEGIFSRGKGILTGYDELGNKVREVEYENNMRNGTEKWFDRAGKPQKVFLYKNDKLVQTNTDR